jgi:hypothetical protein
MMEFAEASKTRMFSSSLQGRIYGVFCKSIITANGLINALQWVYISALPDRCIPHLDG